MVKLLKRMIGGKNRNMKDTTSALPLSYPVGSTEWIEAHKTKAGGYHVTAQDRHLLMQDPKWREEFRKYKMAVIHLNTVMERKRREFNK